jgi:hypothetical protein
MVLLRSHESSVAAISVAKEVGQNAATINYQKLTTMFAGLQPASLKNAVWVCNSPARVARQIPATRVGCGQFLNN